MCMDLDKSLKFNVEWNVWVVKAYVWYDIIYVKLKIYTAIL